MVDKIFHRKLKTVDHEHHLNVDEPRFTVRVITSCSTSGTVELLIKTMFPYVSIKSKNMLNS